MKFNSQSFIVGLVGIILVTSVYLMSCGNTDGVSGPSLPVDEQSTASQGYPLAVPSTSPSLVPIACSGIIHCQLVPKKKKKKYICTFEVNT